MESFLPSKNKQPTRLPVYCTSKVSRLQTSELPFIQPFPFLAKLCNTDVALLERLSVSGVGGGDGFHSRRGILRRYMRVENCEVKCVTGRRGGNRRDGESMSSFLVVPRNATRRGWPCSRKNKSVLARYQNFALLIIHPKMRGWSAFIILRCCILKFRDYLMEEKLDREWLRRRRFSILSFDQRFPYFSLILSIVEKEISILSTLTNANFPPFDRTQSRFQLEALFPSIVNFFSFFYETNRTVIAMPFIHLSIN